MKVMKATALIASAVISTSAYAETHVGPRVAAIAGYDSFSLGSGSRKSDGAAFGLGVGYDIPVGENVALGLDAEISGASTKNREPVLVGGGPSSPIFGPPVVGPPSIVGEVKTSLGRELYFGGRASVQLSNTISAYLTAGYANLRLKSHATSTISVGPIGGPLGLLASATDAIGGVRLGVGSQLAITKTIFASLEYRYANYERKVSRNQVSAGIGLRF